MTRKVVTPSGRELCGATFPEGQGFMLCTSHFDHDGDHYCTFRDLYGLLETGFTVVNEPEFDVEIPMEDVSS